MFMWHSFIEVLEDFREIVQYCCNVDIHLLKNIADSIFLNFIFLLFLLVFSDIDCKLQIYVLYVVDPLWEFSNQHRTLWSQVGSSAHAVLMLAAVWLVLWQKLELMETPN